MARSNIFRFKHPEIPPWHLRPGRHDGKLLRLTDSHTQKQSNSSCINTKKLIPPTEIYCAVIFYFNTTCRVKKIKINQPEKKKKVSWNKDQYYLHIHSTTLQYIYTLKYSGEHMYTWPCSLSFVLQSVLKEGTHGTESGTSPHTQRALTADTPRLRWGPTDVEFT